MRLSILFLVYHGNSSLVQDPWVNKPWQPDYGSNPWHQVPAKGRNNEWKSVFIVYTYLTYYGIELSNKYNVYEQRIISDTHILLIK